MINNTEVIIPLYFNPNILQLKATYINGTNVAEAFLYATFTFSWD